jgi:hypothetical protein
MKWLLLLIWFILGSVIWVPTGKGVFGVCISYQANGAFTTYIAYMKGPNGISNKRRLLEDEFIKYASGFWPSIYNKDKDNLFALEHIGCGIEVDPSTKIQYLYCSPMDSLWKLRFGISPMKGIQEEGWSGKSFRPSSGQEKYLYKEFGIHNMDHDFFVDTNLWKLMRSVTDPEWINYYKNLP